MTTTSSAVKQASRKTQRRAGPRVEWRDILAAVQATAERSLLVSTLSGAGFSVDDFANLNDCRGIVCDWLSRYEDRREDALGRRSDDERERVRAVRRRLELELFQ